ncbi:MAG TPA: hypothetical protein VJT09_08220 [Pyrinomonadaceae bacterium]|nr:hypothetical protein [Pyrinomonadaceae bacterium]
MNMRPLRRPLLQLALLLLSLGSAYAQQPTVVAESEQRAASYTFVSPNTRENLTLRQAVRLLNSREELQLIGRINHLSRCLRLKPFVTKAIGNSTDGAEHSALFRVYTDRPTLRYADARLGKVQRQKTVLNFRQADSGTARMYSIRIRMGRRTLASIARTLDESGVPFRTLVPQARRRMLIYVVDLDSQLSNQVASAARRLGGLLSMIKGTGEFIGNDADRDRAQEVFTEEIRRFEDAHAGVARRCSR